MDLKSDLEPEILKVDGARLSPAIGGPRAKVWTPDKKAYKALAAIYDADVPWGTIPAIPSEVHAHGISVGVMFEKNVTFNHDELVESLRALVQQIDPREVGAAFIASLSTRTAYWQTPLGSYAFARQMPEHAYEPWQNESRRTQCGICGKWPEPELLDLNRMSYFRLNWGGGPHDSIKSAWFNLSQFIQYGAGSPTDEDWRLWNEVLSVIRSIPQGRPASDLERAMGKVLKSNRNERIGIIESLAIAGILENPKYPGYFDQFIRNDISNHGSIRISDWEYPACRWKATGTVNERALKFWFG